MFYYVLIDYYYSFLINGFLILPENIISLL